MDQGTSTDRDGYGASNKSRKISNTILTVLIVVALIAITVWWVMHGRNSSDDTGTSGNDNGQSQQTPSTTNDQTSASKINIDNMLFSPASLTVKKGTTVTWTNHDGVAHTVTRRGDTGPDSPMIQPGETYSFVFDTVGTFEYFCTVHPSMTGKVIVTE